MKFKDGFGKSWKYRQIPEYVKKLNENITGIIFEKNGYWFSKHLKLKNDKFKIDVLFEIDIGGGYRMYTYDLKYGVKLEIFFDKKKQCFTIKNLDKLRAEWRKSHSEEDVKDNVFENFIMEVKNL